MYFTFTQHVVEFNGLSQKAVHMGQKNKGNKIDSGKKKKKPSYSDDNTQTQTFCVIHPPTVEYGSITEIMAVGLSDLKNLRD